jgi:hypothetical protein
VINNKQQAISVRHPKIENLMTMPEHAIQLVRAKRRVSPILTKQGEIGSGKTFDFNRQQCEFTLKSDAAPVGHKSSTIASSVA